MHRATTHQTSSGLSSRCRAEDVRARGAFTLIELLAVIAVMLTLMAVGLPSLRGWRDAQAASTASGQILALLKEARSLAITQDRPAYLVISNHTLQSAGATDPAAPEAWRMMAIYQQQADPALPPKQVSRWYRLPEGCSLLDSAEHPSLLHAPNGDADAPLFSRPGEATPVALPYLAFNEAGGVLHPARSEHARLWLRTAPETPPGKVSVALFTGRPSCVW